ncbi:MAG: hypothetical protein H6825_15020 [Planctomycetes bacterium]|nr:hypothetical protein [Planctomycetota bacterium]
MHVLAPPAAAARAVRPRTPRTALALLLLVASAGAQSVDLFVSTSTDADLSGSPVRDSDVLSHRPGLPAAFALPAEALSALAGDPTGSGLHVVFGDIDALHVSPGGLASDGLYISLLSNENGFLDGDVLALSQEGASVFRSEAEFAAAAGASDGNVDVDAFSLDADGTIWFSFAEDEASAFLSGDQPGSIGDGDVLVWPAGQSVAQIVYTEAQIDAFVSAALGASTSTVDTRGLARDAAGQLLFVVQSPSAHDASVFTTAGGGALLDGHDEASFGFGADEELDALSVAPSLWPGLAVSEPRPAAGGSFSFEVWDAEPGAPHVVLMALDLGPSWLPLAGWGGLVLADDALFFASAHLLPSLTVLPDAAGRASLALDVPAALTALDVTAQAVCLGAGASASDPLVVELAQ